MLLFTKRWSRDKSDARHYDPKAQFFVNKS